MDIQLNVSLLKHTNPDISIQELKNEFEDNGAVTFPIDSDFNRIYNERDVTGELYMNISELDKDTIEQICANFGFDYRDFLINDDYDEIGPEDIAEKNDFNNMNRIVNRRRSFNEDELTGFEFDNDYPELLLEKRRQCCPPRKSRINEKASQRHNIRAKELIESVKREAGTYRSSINESAAYRRAIEKAGSHRGTAYNEALNALGSEKVERIINNIRNNKPCLYEKSTLNGRRIASYSTNELMKVYNKVKSLNESYGPNKEMKNVYDILDEELTYRITREQLLKKNSVSNDILEHLGREKTDMILNNLRQHKPYLYESIKINDKRIRSYSTDELLSLYKKVKNKKRTLNESNASRSALLKNNKIFNILDEELTYRLCYEKYLNEDDENLPAASTDPFNSLINDETDTKGDSTNPEDDEVVELSRIVITLQDDDAADKLKDYLTDEGISDTKIEIKPEGDESEETENTSESVYYKKMRYLFEDDEDADNAEDASTEDKEKPEGEEGGDESDDKKEKSDDNSGNVQLILSDPSEDDVEALKNVLVNKYGYTEEEFAETIGGEIVTSDDEEGDDDKSDEKEDKSDNKEEKSSGDEEADSIDPSELFKGL